MKTALSEITDISFDDLDAIDIAEMTVVINGKITDWVWQFAGPGHPQAIEQKNRLQRENLHKERLKEQAQVNGKKWKAPEENVDEVRTRNIGIIVGRIVGWSPIKIAGELLPFSPEAAHRLLSDPRKDQLLTQVADFLSDDAAFLKR